MFVCVWFLSHVCVCVVLVTCLCVNVWQQCCTFYQAALLFSNNSVAAVDVVMDGSNNVKLENSVSIHHAGHRSEVRTLSFSFDGKLILSASAEQAKLWNRYFSVIFFYSIGI